MTTQPTTSVDYRSTDDNLHPASGFGHRSHQKSDPALVQAQDLPRGALIVLAVLSLLGGVAAIFSPLMAAVALEIVLGATLLLLGLSQLACAFQTKGWRGTTALVASALLSLLVGGLLLGYPIAGMVTVAVMVGAFLFVGGIMRTVLSIRLRPNDGWAYLLVNGIATTVLGGILLFVFPLPTAAGWILGLMVGFDLLANSLWLFVLGTQRLAYRERQAPVAE